MKQQKTTPAKQTVRVVTNLEPSLVEKIDRERAGICGRAAILRLAIVERYKRQTRSRRSSSV